MKIIFIEPTIKKVKQLLIEAMDDTARHEAEREEHFSVLLQAYGASTDQVTRLRDLALLMTWKLGRGYFRELDEIEYAVKRGHSIDHVIGACEMIVGEK